MRMRLEPQDDFLHEVESASNFNESRYYNWFDPEAGFGGWVRMGNRPNEKYADGYKMANDLRQLYGEDPDARRVIDVARGLEGLRRQDGIHAAAVVITKDPLTSYLPIQRKPEAGQNPEDAPMVTQFEMHAVEDADDPERRPELRPKLIDPGDHVHRGSDGAGRCGR